MSTPDLYGGTAVTTQNIYRKVGGTSTTDIAGAGTFTPGVGEQYEIIIGIDSDDDDAEPYGASLTYTVPCKEVDEIETQVIDDALATDLTVIATDPDDGNNIGGGDPVDIDAGQVKTIPIKWTGSFEEDFGNRWCEEEGVRNVIVVRYNTTTMDKVYVTDTQAQRYPVATYQITKLLASIAGYSDAVYEFPVIKSNADYNANIVFDAGDGAANEPTGTNSNITVYLYDVNRFINNDFTPAKFQCGIMDEDGAEVGAAAPDFLAINITSD